MKKTISLLLLFMVALQGCTSDSISCEMKKKRNFNLNRNQSQEFSTEVLSTIDLTGGGVASTIQIEEQNAPVNQPISNKKLICITVFLTFLITCGITFAATYFLDPILHPCKADCNTTSNEAALLDICEQNLNSNATALDTCNQNLNSSNALVASWKAKYIQSTGQTTAFAQAYSSCQTIVSCYQTSPCGGSTSC